MTNLTKVETASEIETRVIPEPKKVQIIFHIQASGVVQI